MSSKYNEDSAFWKREKKLIQSDFLLRPHIYKLTDDLKGKVVADLGAGEGYVSKEILKRGAKKVIAVEKSNKMIKESMNDSPEINWFKGDVSRLKIIKNQSVDIALSIMVYPHLNKKQMYLANKEVFRILKKGGVFILGIPHPLMFVSLPKTKWYKIYDKDINYWNLKKVELSLFSGKNDEFGPFHAYNHTLSSTINSLTNNNLQIVELLEPKPNKKDLEIYSEMWGEESKKPFYLLIKCIKK